MSLLNREASFTISAAGRACRPTWLTICHGAFRHQRITEKRTTAATTRRANRQPSSAALQPDHDHGAYERRQQNFAQLSALRTHDDAARASGMPTPAARAAARPRIVGPRRSTGCPSAGGDPQPLVPPRTQPPYQERHVARRCTEAERITTTAADAADPNSASATAGRQNGSQPAHTSRSPTLPNGPHSARAESLDALRGLAVELGAGQRAHGDRGQVRVRIEVPILAGQRLLESPARARRRGADRSAGSRQNAMPLPISVS